MSEWRVLMLHADLESHEAHELDMNDPVNAYLSLKDALDVFTTRTCSMLRTTSRIDHTERSCIAIIASMIGTCKE